MKHFNHALLATSLAALLAGGVPALAQDTKPMTQTEAAVSGSDAAPTVEMAVAESKDSGTLQRSHAEMKKVIQKLMDLGAKGVHELTVEQARTQPTAADAVRAVYQEEKGEPAIPEAVSRTEDTTVDGAAGKLEARVYWPADMPADNAALPVILYFHGGGWVVANLDVYDASPRALANQAKSVVISSEYRKGPEAKFPAAPDDAVAVYKYVVENAGKWNGDSKRIAIAGESAGGNLAMDVAIAARDEKLTSPVGVLAVYPVASNDLTTQSYIDNQNAVPLGKADIEWFLDKYLASPDHASDTRLNVVAADLKGLPPVTIVAAEIDPLRSDGVMLADKLKTAGVDVAYRLRNDTTHEFFGKAAVVPEAKAAQDFAGERLRAVFGM